MIAASIFHALADIASCAYVLSYHVTFLHVSCVLLKTDQNIKHKTENVI